MSDMILGAAFVAAVYIMGYASAHNDVARECERLGGFYVGQQTFTCSPSEQKHGGAK